MGFSVARGSVDYPLAPNNDGISRTIIPIDAVAPEPLGWSK
jgi:hypothetical protein